MILLASRMEAAKGHAVLLDALGALQDRPGWLCWMAGGAQHSHGRSYERTVRRRASTLGVESRVRFLGQRDDVGALMEAADIFCQPNASPEPFGVVFVEAMLHGLPVVASASGGTVEIVDPGCGVLVEAGNSRAVARALTQLLDDPARRTAFGAAGRARARELCDPATQVSALAALCRDAAQRGRDAA